MLGEATGTAGEGDGTAGEGEGDSSGEIAEGHKGQRQEGGRGGREEGRGGREEGRGGQEEGPGGSSPGQVSLHLRATEVSRLALVHEGRLRSRWLLDLVFRRSPLETLPEPTLEMQVTLPKLEKFKTNALLQVKEFQDFVAPNTTTERPLFLRKHLLNVHKKAVEALKAKKIRLVSLVDCPGTGKTWCGWLVAYTLQKTCKKKTLHLTIRNSTVTAIANFETKQQYEEVHWNGHMLKQVLRESECQLCIVDVSMNKPDAALDIFTGIQQLIERGRDDKEFAGVKFMGLLSGHGQEKITGKQLPLQVIQKLVLWSWSEEEVTTLSTKLKDAGSKPPSDEAYKVCGGSVRYLSRPDEDENRIREAVKGLSQDEMKRLLALDTTLDDQQGKNRSRLLSFFAGSSVSSQRGQSPVPTSSSSASSRTSTRSLRRC